MKNIRFLILLSVTTFLVASSPDKIHRSFIKVPMELGN